MAEAPLGVLATLDEARSWVGHHLDDVTGSPVARVEGVFADSDSGQPVWLIAKLGRFGKPVPVPFLDIAHGAGRLWVPYSRDDLRDAPAVDPRRALTREQELRACAHYAIPPDFGRAAQLADREEGAVTARPAPLG